MESSYPAVYSLRHIKEPPSCDALVAHYTHQGVKDLGQAIESAMSGTACSTVSITVVSYSTHCV